MGYVWKDFPLIEKNHPAIALINDGIVAVKSLPKISDCETTGFSETEVLESENQENNTVMSLRRIPKEDKQKTAVL